MKCVPVTAIIGLLLLSGMILALSAGKYPLGLSDISQLLAGNPPHDPRLSIVFWQIRMPRMLAALLIGAGLAAAGTTYQGMFRNPLVSPDILGVSAGAGMGASVAILLGLSMFYIQGLAFVGGLLVVALVCVIARFTRRQDPVLSLVLIGIAIGTLCGAMISLIKVLADPYTELPSITFWLLGGLNTITISDLQVAAPLTLLGLLPLWLLRWRMNLLSLPDEEASAMGVNVTRLRVIFIVSATLVTASAVAIAGIIGWVGLVVPHICRIITGANNRSLLPMSMAVGAILLLVTDTLARTVSSVELPLGILTAMIGAPFFLLLLMRRERL
ncbi:FecCD family ABC transporter permease [Shewanella fodinae]|uniref:Iron complex transport system permease protein n=1 Tax=Shewanella fodinae TaxID=552357 RepID=A0A4R2FHD4_9GAMM|nr:iron ABC transporter permease [Shewanella fodinae]TCN90552.1 iron complex transport system permease protein [Shewanella fodinae]